MKRTLCALLCMLLLTSSCGSTSEPTKESTDPAAQNDTATESEETAETVLTADLPTQWTYPQIQPKLLAELERRGVIQ